MATYAVGDVQGCYAELLQLLGDIGFDAGRDRLWFVGDLVNRGPQSLEVLRFVKSLDDTATTVLGNHDLHLLMQAEGYGHRNAEDTLDAVLQAPDREQLLSWLRTRPLCHVEGQFVLVHAGLLPGWSATKARDVAGEAERALAGPEYRRFLAHMRGSQPACWDDSLTGWDRLRVVINAMTRMRVCSQAGEMDLQFKGSPRSAPHGYLPWFSIAGRASSEQTIVCGHWSALGLYIEEKLFALDSGCFWGNALSAMRLEDRQVFQVPCLSKRPVPTKANAC